MFNETEFIQNFVKYYLNNTLYECDEINILYDDYVESIVYSNSQEINEHIISLYDNPTNVDVTVDIQEKAANILYDKFYVQAEAAVTNHYDSNADTDGSDD